MSAAELASYLGWALAYALLATVPAAAVARAACGVPLRDAAWVALPSLFLVFLSQHPFPPLGGLDCPAAAAVPRLKPFGFLDLFAEAYGRRTGPVGWLFETGPASTLMNLALCAVIGWALGRAGVGPGGALGFAAALSLGIELTQVTGIWGLYPCAYRQFDVDDLILNVGGVGLGVWLARRRTGRIGGSGRA